mmetsp:Transcript_1027/g.2823  ORF Transcript_1027/g.2823 Transcript_1027/m.2823 type:complete len:322 (-) Transcript_1027:273-1238(-)
MPVRGVPAALRHGRRAVEAARLPGPPRAPRRRPAAARGPARGPSGRGRGPAPGGPVPADRGPDGPAARGAQDHGAARGLGGVAAVRGVQRRPGRGRARAEAQGRRQRAQPRGGYAADGRRDAGPRRGRAPAPGLGRRPCAHDAEGADCARCGSAGRAWRPRHPPAAALCRGSRRAEPHSAPHLEGLPASCPRRAVGPVPSLDIRGRDTPIAVRKNVDICVRVALYAAAAAMSLPQVSLLDPARQLHAGAAPQRGHSCLRTSSLHGDALVYVAGPTRPCSFNCRDIAARVFSWSCRLPQSAIIHTLLLQSRLYGLSVFLRSP